MTRTPITVDAMERMEMDESGRLYWDGKAVITEQKFTLGWIERVLVSAAAVGTLVAAIWPILVHFKIVGPA